MRPPVCHNPNTMKLLRMKPGHGEIVLAEGDVEVPEEAAELIEAFRRELDAGMWAAVPTEAPGGRREAELVEELRRRAARRRACDLLPARRRRSARGEQLGAMALALGTAAIVMIVLLWELSRPRMIILLADPSRAPLRAPAERHARLRSGPRAPRRATRQGAAALVRRTR